MAKIKKTGIAKPSSDHNVKLNTLPQRELVLIQAELSPEGKFKVSHDTIPEGSVVKLVFRYHAKDEEQAGPLIDELTTFIRSKARFLRPIERVIIQEGRKRMEEMKNFLNPVEAVDIWLAKKPPKGIDVERIKQIFREQLVVASPKAEKKVAPADFRIRGIHIRNFLPYKGSQTVKGIPDGLIGVVGRYLGQDGRSNRSGKSSVFDAMLFALFAEGRPGIASNDKYLNEGCADLDVALKLELPEKEFVLLRGLEDVGQLRSFTSIDNVRVKISEAEGEIFKVVGMTKEDFEQTCFVRQGDLEKILSQTSSKLKEDIIRWRGLDVWTHIDEALQPLLRKVEGSVGLYESRKTTAKEMIEKTKRPDQEKINEIRKMISLANEAIAASRTAKERMSLIRGQIEIASKFDEMRKTLKRETKVRERLDSLRDEIEDHEKVLSDATQKKGVAVEAWMKAKELLKKGFSGGCPLDGADCPRKKEINDNAEKFSTACETARLIYRESEQAVVELESKRRELFREKESLEVELNTVEKAKEYLDRYKGLKIEELEKQLEEVTKEAKVESIQSEAMRLQDELTKLMADEKAIKNAEELLADSEERLQKVMVELRELRYVRTMVGKYGIPSMLIENSLEEIEVHVNSILEGLGSDHRLKFDTERETKKLSQHCFDCGYVYGTSALEKYCPDCGVQRQNAKTDDLRPMIVEGTRKQEFELDSGAGRALVALATRVAMSRFLGAKVLFLDEISGALDSYNVAMLIKLLHKLPDMGFRQVFVISHQKEVDDAMPNQIVVTRYQEESRSELSVGWEK